MDASLLDLMPETVSIEPYTGQDTYGTPTYGAAVSYQCAIQGSVDNSTAFDKSQVTHVKVYLASAPGITSRDRLTLPARWTPTQPKIMKVRYLEDEGGAYCEVLET